MEAARRGYILLTVDHEYSSSMEKDGLKYLLDHNVEAVIVCHPCRIKNYAILHNTDVRLIQIERLDLSHAHRIKIDPQRGFNEAVEHLVALNHERICFVSGGSQGSNNPQATHNVETYRIQAFANAIVRCGLDPRLCPVNSVPYDRGRASSDLQGYILGRRLLATPQRPSAIILGADVFAAGLLQAARELELRVPDELSVIGFDDSIAKLLSPPLSTIVQPQAEIARRALHAATGPDVSDTDFVQEVVETELRIRKSTALAP
jgi:LacI family transcriptional regulator